MKRFILISAWCLCFLNIGRTIAREFCSDVMVLDGGENLVVYGLDTTNNWWAISSPYESMLRLHVNGKRSGVYQDILTPTFSPDGEHWATWALFNNFWTVVTEAGPLNLQCTAHGDIQYSGNSQSLIYSYYDGTQEVIISRSKKLPVIARTGKIYSNFSGDRIACVTGQFGISNLLINGKTGEFYDEIKPIGFWLDGSFMYAARSGTQWRVYRGEEEVAGAFSNVPEVTINPAGTNAAIIVEQTAGRQVLLFSDEYTRTVSSRIYDGMDALVLHPTQPMWAARATKNGSALVVMTGADYSAGFAGTGRPYFTHDGKDLVFFGCDADCFTSVNGKKVAINSTMNSDGTYPHKPLSQTFAYSSSTSLVVRMIERNDLWVSKMCDETSLPRYNWRTDRYEALGRINQRLYLLSCMN